MAFFLPADAELLFVREFCFFILAGQGDHEGLQVICFGRINNVFMLCTPPYEVPILHLLERNSKKTLKGVYSAALLFRDEKKSQKQRNVRRV